MSRVENKFRHIYPARRGLPDLTLSDMDEYVGATMNLAMALGEKFSKNFTERRYSGAEVAPVALFDAFFRSQEPGFAFRITSVGLPGDGGKNGMFLHVSVKEEGQELREVLSLQTAKRPDVVRWEEAFILTRFSVQQLRFFAEFVRQGTPVSRDEFSKIGILP